VIPAAALRVIRAGVSRRLARRPRRTAPDPRRPEVHPCKLSGV